MNLVIIDCRDPERPDNRSSLIRDKLISAGHSAYILKHAPCGGSSHLLSSVNAIVLHCGQDQGEAEQFLIQCADIPVLGLAGNPGACSYDGLFHACRTYALYPYSVTQPTVTQLDAFARWAHDVEAAHGDASLIEKACKLLVDFDEELENALVQMIERCQEFTYPYGRATVLELTTERDNKKREKDGTPLLGE